MLNGDEIKNIKYRQENKRVKRREKKKVGMWQKKIPFAFGEMFDE